MASNKAGAASNQHLHGINQFLVPGESLREFQFSADEERYRDIDSHPASNWLKR